MVDQKVVLLAVLLVDYLVSTQAVGLVVLSVVVLVDPMVVW